MVFLGHFHADKLRSLPFLNGENSDADKRENGALVSTLASFHWEVLSEDLDHHACKWQLTYIICHNKIKEYVK